MPAKETLLTAVQATNFPNYMYEVGMDGFTRKIACSLYPTATNELVDGQIKISTSSTFKSGENVFNLGEPFTETTADGREVTTTATREGNTLVKNQVCVDTSSSCLSTIESREFQEDGLKMTLVHTIPGHPNIRSVRVYMKVTMGIMGKNPYPGTLRG